MLSMCRAWFSAGVLLCGMVVAGGAQAATLLIVGDSISAAYGVPAEKSWVALLQKRLDAKHPGWKIANAAMSGDTTAGALSRLPAALRQYTPQIVLIELGGNDGLQGLRLKNTRDNLTRMVRAAKKEGAKVMLVGIDLPPSYGAKYVNEFHNMYPSVAKATGAVLVSGFLAEVGKDPDLMQSDGIHPNSLGQPKLVDSLWPFLEPLIVASSSAAR